MFVSTTSLLVETRSTCFSTRSSTLTALAALSTSFTSRTSSFGAFASPYSCSGARTGEFIGCYQLQLATFVAANKTVNYHLSNGCSLVTSRWH